VDLATVDALARAALHARRAGARLRVVKAPPELQQLIELAGLTEVLFGRDGRQPEQREQPLRIQKRGKADDPPL
jgi:anti-anti-sigma regulatory factor